MWPAEVTALEFPSPFYLAVSLVRNGLQANQHTQDAQKERFTGRERERGRGMQGEQIGGKGSEAFHLLLHC